MTTDELMAKMDAVAASHAKALEAQINNELKVSECVEIVQAMQHLQWRLSQNHAMTAQLLEHVIRARATNELMKIDEN